MDKKILEASTKSLRHPGQLISKLPKAELSDALVLYVFRHGETYDNARRIFCGRRNSNLTPKGLDQAKVLAEKLKNSKIDLAVSSPLIRTQRTMKEVLKYHIKTKIEEEPLLLERDYGDLTGKSKIRLAKKDPYLTAKYRRAYDFPPPNGESLKDVKEKRVYPFCNKIKNIMREEKINVAICCTNNTMRLIRMYFENLSIEEMQILENPLGGDYAQYVVSN